MEVPLIERDDADRFVIIGMDAITPLGIGIDQTWSNLIAGKHGFVPISEIEQLHYKDPADGELKPKPGMEFAQSKIAAPVDSDFDMKNYPIFDPKERRDTDNSAQLAAAAIYGAGVQAGIVNPETGQLIHEKVDRWRVSTYVGSAFAGAHTIDEIKPDRVKPSQLFKTLYGRSASAPAHALQANAEVVAASTECSSSLSALHNGIRSLWRKPWGEEPDSDILIVAGAESVLAPKPILAFESLELAVDTRDVEDIDIVSRSMDKDRQGSIFGEGSAAIVVTSLKKARELGITNEDIQAEIVTTVHLTDAENKTLNGSEGQQRLFKVIMTKAGVTIEDIVYVNGHFTATPGGDEAEASNTGKAVDEYGISRDNVYLGSTKCSTGHLLGAAGAAEAIFTVMSLNQGIIAGQRNLENLIDEAHGFKVVKEATPVDISVGLSVNFGFGGSAAGIALKKFVA